ncbi:MAG: transcription antitermination factor NusB [Ruminococcaceae bacterium]|nr:transcription antitermination factor NusB [Oscillospiraceae bacterium]
MTRHEERESVFCLCFEYSLNITPTQELIELAQLCRELVVTEYVEKTFLGIIEHRKEIDEKINENIKGWKLERLSKVSLAVLRLAVYEILFAEGVPESVAINEAVELAKAYDTDEAPSFINGVLGSISRTK